MQYRIHGEHLIRSLNWRWAHPLRCQSTSVLRDFDQVEHFFHQTAGGRSVTITTRSNPTHRCMHNCTQRQPPMFAAQGNLHAGIQAAVLRARSHLLLLMRARRHTPSRSRTTNEGAAGKALIWNREIRMCSGASLIQIQRHQKEERRWKCASEESH